MRNLFASALIIGLASPMSLAFAQDHSGHGAPAGQAMSGASQAYMDAMAKMDSDMQAMTMTGKPGADFMLMMIPHHQAAIDMAKAYLASGENDPEITKLSNDVIAAQEREIAEMREWLKKNGHGG